MDENRATPVQEPQIMPSLYCDCTSFNFNYDNISLLLQSKSPAGINLLGIVKFSPQTAKGLAASIKNIVKEYESIYGRIGEFNEKAREKEAEAIKTNLMKQDERINNEINEIKNKLEAKKTEREKLAKELAET